MFDSKFVKCCYQANMAVIIANKNSIKTNAKKNKLTKLVNIHRYK